MSKIGEGPVGRRFVRVGIPRHSFLHVTVGGDFEVVHVVLRAAGRAVSACDVEQVVPRASGARNGVLTGDVDVRTVAED